MKTVEELAAKETELLARRLTAVAAVTAASAAAGEALIDSDGQGAPAVDGITRARDAVTAIDAALVACRARRLEAIAAKRKTGAAALRKQASDLRGQLTRLEEKTAKALQALADLQGVPYSAQPAPALVGQIPKSAQLQSQISSADQQAADLERDVPTSGSVDVEDATDVEPLLKAMLRTEAAIPTVRAVIDWARAVEQHARRAFGENPRRFHLVWKDGQVDAAESYIQVGALAKVGLGSYGGTVFEAGSDIFRAPFPPPGFGGL